MYPAIPCESNHHKNMFSQRYTFNMDIPSRIFIGYSPKLVTKWKKLYISIAPLSFTYYANFVQEWVLTKFNYPSDSLYIRIILCTIYILSCLYNAVKVEQPEYFFATDGTLEQEIRLNHTFTVRLRAHPS